jgi:hypothetical protein
VFLVFLFLDIGSAALIPFSLWPPLFTDSFDSRFPPYSYMWQSFQLHYVTPLRFFSILFLQPHLFS